MCLQVGWRGPDGQEMNRESGVVGTPLSVAYVVSVRSSFAFERTAHLVGATTPTPCRNGS